jgi:hypothetical protein
MFSGCQKLKDVKMFDTQYITSMNGTFKHTSIDCDLSHLKINSVQHMDDFILAQEPWIPQSFSVENYDILLNSFASQTRQSGVDLEVEAKYSAAGAAAHDALTNSPSSWSILDSGQV